MVAKDVLLVNMLKSVSEMLDDCKPERIECAKTIIDQLVLYLDTSTTTLADAVGTAALDPELDEEAIQAQGELIG